MLTRSLLSLVLFTAAACGSPGTGTDDMTAGTDDATSPADGSVTADATAAVDATTPGDATTAGDAALPTADAVVPADATMPPDDLTVPPGDLAGADLTPRDLATLNDLTAAADLVVVNDATTVADMTTRKRIFVTSLLYPGNLMMAGGGTSGLDGADRLCQARATNLGGTWKAWLSDASTDAIARIADVGPWYRMDGALIFASRAAMTGNPAVAINRDEANATVTGLGAIPWTGTLSTGLRAASTCMSWISSVGAQMGECGSASSTTATWTQNLNRSCSIPYPLYCVEQ